MAVAVSVVGGVASAGGVAGLDAGAGEGVAVARLEDAAHGHFCAVDEQIALIVGHADPAQEAINPGCRWATFQTE